MTNRERMLRAYRRQTPDQVPASPELWYDFGVLIDKNCTWQDICFGRYPLWKAQLAAHRFFGSAAWLMAGPKGGIKAGTIRTTHQYTPDGDLEFHHVGQYDKGTLEWRVRNNEHFYDWMSEHPVKDAERDLDGFRILFMPDVDSLDLSKIDAAVQGVGNDGIVTAHVGSLFFGFVAYHFEGGPGQAILAMIDHEPLFRDLHAEYLERIERVAERIAGETSAQILMLENGFSTAGIISPDMYRQWDIPVVETVANVAARNGKLLHLHQHGKCLALMDEIASSGVDLVEPFERPPSGDTPDLGVIKRKYGDRIAIRGNLHAHETLLRGTPADVEQEARQCIEAASAGGGFILASGDGVIVGTPFENIFAMVEACEKYGRCLADLPALPTGQPAPLREGLAGQGQAC